jgi:hypothetical protein
VRKEGEFGVVFIGADGEANQGGFMHLLAEVCISPLFSVCVFLFFCDLMLGWYLVV